MSFSRKRARTLSSVSSDSLPATQIMKVVYKKKPQKKFLLDSRQLIPKTFRTTLSWVERIAVTGSAGAVGSQVYNLNSIFDVDRTGAGTHQPLGYDQYSLLFNRYRVWNVKYEIEVVNNTAVIGNVAVSANNHNPGSLPPPTIFERDEVQMRMLGGLANEKSTSRFVGIVKLPKLMGVSDTQYTGSDLTSAAINADPSELMTLAVNIQEVTATATMTVYGYCKMWFDVQFFDPVEPAQS